MLVTTSNNEVKILDRNGALSETLPIDKRATLAKFAPNSDIIAIFAFSKASSRDGNAVAQVWNLQSKQMLYEIACHSGEIKDVCFTPLQGLVAVSSTDGFWSMHDFVNLKQLLKLKE
jgi:WD40 repeat protein